MTDDVKNALHLLITQAQQQDKFQTALELCQAALTVDARDVLALVNMAVCWRRLGNGVEARAAIERALALAPELDIAQDVGGWLARDAGDVMRACVLHKAAVAQQPDNPVFLNNYAMSLLAEGSAASVVEAELQSRRALKLAPDEAVFHLTHGYALRAAGYAARALEEFLSAGRNQPALMDAHSNAALSCLLMGDWQRGFHFHETRVQDSARFAKLRRWDGEVVEHLLLHAEQGLGDTIQFLRYVELARPFAQKITLQIQPALRELVARSIADVALITPQDVLPNVDAHCPLMSLPLLFDTEIHNVPAPLALKLDEKKIAHWRDKLAGVKAPRIGIVWAGNPKHPNDRNRSCPREMIAPLVEKYGAHLLSLQNGLVEALDARADFAPTQMDADEMAALMASLDLVIAVDTMPAHLAGTLGKPVWILLPFDPDWRWLYGRADSVWYDKARLFRQTAPRDWTSVIMKIDADLARLLAGDASVLSPLPYVGAPLGQSVDALVLAD